MKSSANWKDTGRKICARCSTDKPVEEFAFSGGYPSWYKECHRVASREYKHCPDNRSAEKHRERHLKAKYNMSSDDYSLMALEQNNQCAICNEQKDTLCVDHSHETGKVRGLLCTKCNAALGLLGDSVDVLISAIEYLRKNAQ